MVESQKKPEGALIVVPNYIAICYGDELLKIWYIEQHKKLKVMHSWVFWYFIHPRSSISNAIYYHKWTKKIGDYKRLEGAPTSEGWGFADVPICENDISHNQHFWSFSTHHIIIM